MIPVTKVELFGKAVLPLNNVSVSIKKCHLNTYTHLYKVHKVAYLLQQQFCKFYKTSHLDGIDDTSVGHASSLANLVCLTFRKASCYLLVSYKILLSPLYNIHIIISFIKFVLLSDLKIQLKKNFTN